jgi:hypothetical protein
VSTAAPIRATPALRLRFKKGSDGRLAAFALERADGTVTVMQAPHAFFPIHDLTHYALETALRYTRGFYGLVSEGWNFDDFGSPWPRGPMPPDIDPAELLVGFLDLERATGFPMSADDVNDRVASHYRERSLTAPAPITEDQLSHIRALLERLTARWHDTPPNATLELPYNPGQDMPEDS